MDPNENLKRQRELAREIIVLRDANKDDGAIVLLSEELAELVLALDQWRLKGGFDPHRPASPSASDDSLYRLDFGPVAIREHFADADDEDEVATWVRSATDDELRAVGEGCIASDSLYREFHSLLVRNIEDLCA